MTTTTRSKINGAVNTANSVLDNIQKLATAAGCYITWDAAEGRWSFTLNQAGSSVFTFDDNNIIGGIDVTNGPLEQMYNRVTVQFPHEDLRDKVDTVTFRVPESEWNTLETDNPLNINLELVNDPVQAQLIGARELKQSRYNKSVTFSADYSCYGVKPGDIVAVNNTAYGWNGELFRIINIEEVDSEDGSFYFNLQLQEYNSSVYSTSGLIREERNTETGILPKELNVCLAQEDNSELSQTVQDGSIQDGITSNTGIIPVLGPGGTVPSGDQIGMGLATVGYLAGSNVDITSQAADYTESDSDYFFIDGFAEFDPDDATYRVPTGLTFYPPRSGYYALDFNINFLYRVAADGSGNFLLPETWRSKTGLGYKIGSTYSMFAPASIRLNANFGDHPDKNLYQFPSRLTALQPIELFTYAKVDLYTRPETDANTAIFTSLTAKIYYLGDL